MPPHREKLHIWKRNAEIVAKTLTSGELLCRSVCCFCATIIGALLEMQAMLVETRQIMSTQELKGVIREGASKGFSRRLRAAGLIPAVCYGKGLESLSFSVSPVELMKVLSGSYGPNAIFDLVLDDNGKEQRRTVMIRCLQRDPVTRKILHADFYAIDPARKVLVEVPIVLVGRSVGVAMGGRMRQVARSVNVRCLPKHIPETIACDVSKLEIKQRAQVSQITVPEELELVYHADFAVAQVLAPAKSAS